MSYRVFVGMMDWGTLPWQEYVSPTVWYYVDSGSKYSIRRKMARKTLLPISEIRGASQATIVRSLQLHLACAVEAASVDEHEDGSLIVSISSYDVIPKAELPQSYTHLLMCSMAFVPRTIKPDRFVETSRHPWIPRSLEVNEEFWENVEKEELIDSVLSE